MSVAKAYDRLSDWRWRLNNLYYVLDKSGHRTPFRMNWAQEALFDDMHYMNVILKARQLGFTTFIQIFMLDACVFNTNIRAGTIAHNLTDAQSIFRDKVKFPYNNLPEAIRNRVHPVTDSTTELMLSNNSSIRVGTSLRSGTLQYLHISEYGKLCAKYPEKAREVRTGALNTLQAGQVAFIESTAEGREGHFYDLCQDAQTKHRIGIPLTELDFKFHFYPWWKEPGYTIDPRGVVITQAYERYFERLKDGHGIDLTDGQKAWYVKKAESQGFDMKREYPSTPEEAFEASVEGAYYAQQIAKAELDGRIGDFAAHDDVPVHTFWDIGVGDQTAIWFAQFVPSRIRLVGYYENSGEGMPHYTEICKRLARQRGWQLGKHYVPHDARVKEWGTGRTRVEQMLDEGFRVEVVTRGDIDDGINAVRAIFHACEFDEAGCDDGLAALRAYRKEWDEEKGCWKDRPLHNWASNGADAFRYMGMAYREIVPVAPEKPKEVDTRQPTLNEIVALTERSRANRRARI